MFCVLLALDERIVNLTEDTMYNVTNLECGLEEITTRIEDIGANVSCKYNYVMVYNFNTVANFLS